MLLFTIFMALWAVYTAFVLPILWIYIDNETGGYFDVESNKDYFLMSLKWFVMILPGVAVIKAYKLYKKEEQKEN